MVAASYPAMKSYPPMNAQPGPVIAAAAEEWGVQLIEPSSSGYSEVWFAQRGNQHVVIKAGDVAARAREATALAAYTAGSTRVLEHDPDSGALLVERVLLGDDLLPMSRGDDEMATRIVGQLIATLHGSQRHSTTVDLPDLRSLASAFDAAADPRLPVGLVRQARTLFEDLTASSDSVVLHGDLHHFNVLRSGVGDSNDVWLAIDPHGWVGDPAFDTAALMANPRGLSRADSDQLTQMADTRRTERRIAVLAETTGLDAARIRAWAFTAAMIAELWMLEDHNLVHGAPLALAQALSANV